VGAARRPDDQGHHRKDFGVSFGLGTDGSKTIIGDYADVTLDIQAFLEG
jgi:hypothetical protein